MGDRTPRDGTEGTGHDRRGTAHDHRGTTHDHRGTIRGPACGDAVPPAGWTIGAFARAVRDVADAHPGQEVGTTLTALVWGRTGSRLALVHIGDSRAYLLRGGELFQITQDHTLVRSMVDDGRLTPAEADAHPQRSLLPKALGSTAYAPEVRLREARPGDRYVLCSDGLSAVLPPDRLREVVTSGAAPEDAVRELLALVGAAGAPDNVSCVIADVVADREARPRSRERGTAARSRAAAPHGPPSRVRGARSRPGPGPGGRDRSPVRRAVEAGPPTTTSPLRPVPVHRQCAVDRRPRVRPGSALPHVHRGPAPPRAPRSAYLGLRQRTTASHSGTAPWRTARVGRAPERHP